MAVDEADRANGMGSEVCSMHTRIRLVMLVALCVALALACAGTLPRAVVVAAPAAVQQGMPLAAGGASNDQFGTGVAFSADGSTALVGAEGQNGTGAVAVYTRNGATYTPAGTLTVKGGADSSYFGRSVALSADGGVALIGAPANVGGAAYVFTRSGGAYTRTATFTPRDVTGYEGSTYRLFGNSVALSADGGTALVAAEQRNMGTAPAYVFTRGSGGTYTQTATLDPPDPTTTSQFGSSVALSADGGTALVGAPVSHNFTGAAYVFTRSGGMYTQSDSMIDPGGKQYDQFGISVALSADGTTALIGANGRQSLPGAAYLFTGSGGTFIPAATLPDPAGGGTNDQFGTSVALSADGSVALVGAPNRSDGAGAAYLFTRAGGYPQAGAFSATGGVKGDNFGGAYYGGGVALPADGAVSLVGAPGRNSNTGAAYLFANPPAPSGAASVGTASTGATSVATVSMSTPQATASPTALTAMAAGTAVGATAATALPTGTRGASTPPLTASGQSPTPPLMATPQTTATTTATATTATAATGQRQVLTATDGASNDYLGLNVALAVDGGTALAGAPFRNSNTGAAYVFTRGSDGMYAQTPLAVPDGANGDQFGFSVALSADGSTALVGANGRNGGAGAAYLFTRGSGGAYTRTATLTATGGANGDGFGYRVALSADGGTALVSAPSHNGGAGAAYLFTRGNGAYSQTAALTATGGAGGDFFGFSIALSADGGAALVGAPNRSAYAGAAYLFTRGSGAYTQAAALADPAGGANSDYFGFSVALSADGGAALIGANGRNGGAGAAYVYARGSGTYDQATALTATDGASNNAFGVSVALSADGSTALVGANGRNNATGAAYLFIRGSGGAYSQTAALTATDGANNDRFGDSVALSADGGTALVGANGHAGLTGATYVFANSAAPAGGAASGTGTPQATSTAVTTTASATAMPTTTTSTTITATPATGTATATARPARRATATRRDG